jgi:hypothetical protein
MSGKLTLHCIIGLVLLWHPRLSQAASGCDDLSGMPTNPNVRWPAVWLALNDRASCTQNCHLGANPSAELDLGDLVISIYFLVHQTSSFDSTVLRVRPGDPRASLFFQKVNCAQPDVGGQMPPGGLLPLDLQGLIFDWIEQGAYGEGVEDPIPRQFIFRDSMESQRR